MTFIFRSEDIAGWVVCIFLHYYPYFYMLLSIMVYPIAPWMVWGFIITYISNIIFHGCVCFRIERQLFHDKTWFGPYGIMEFWGTEVVTKNVIWAFNVWTKFMFAIIIFKFFVLKQVEPDFRLF
tara:strand:+ start:101 stop:472 length:372 start_codon:yes stop_codon:yes gene_type:complete